MLQRPKKSVNSTVRFIVVWDKKSVTVIKFTDILVGIPGKELLEVPSKARRRRRRRRRQQVFWNSYIIKLSSFTVQQTIEYLSP